MKPPFSLKSNETGSYILLIKVSQEKKIKIGALGLLSFPQGFYAYVGSAMGGFKARIPYHLKAKKKLHWHIDYLLENAKISEVLFCKHKEKIECLLARALAKELFLIPHFGCTDCSCKSHLFFNQDEMTLRAKIIKVSKNYF